MCSRNLKNEEAMARVGPQRQGEKYNKVALDYKFMYVGELISFASTVIFLFTLDISG